MGRIIFIKVMFTLFFLIVISACNKNHGKLLTFNDSRLYYTSNVTVGEAKRLGQYVKSQGLFGHGKLGLGQLNKKGNTYEFRIYIKKGLENDFEVIQTFKLIAKDLSAKVFHGNQVDIHICDKNLQTIRVVVATR